MRSRRQTCRPIEPRIVYAHGPGESSPAIDRSCFGDRYTARHKYRICDDTLRQRNQPRRRVVRTQGCPSRGHAGTPAREALRGALPARKSSMRVRERSKNAAWALRAPQAAGPTGVPFERPWRVPDPKPNAALLVFADETCGPIDEAPSYVPGPGCTAQNSHYGMVPQSTRLPVCCGQ